MATSMDGAFDVWLTEKLKSVSSDIDTDVFVSYIVGILEAEGDDEEKMEGITGLLEGVMEPEIASQVGRSILDEWTETCRRNDANRSEKDDIGDKLSEMMEKHSVFTVKEKQLTDEEKSRKAAILKQYGEISDEESNDDEFDEEASSDKPDRQESSDGGLLMKNTNKEAVEKNIKEAREKSRQENEKKKEKDKQDRLAQKQKAEDRKNTEKKRTQKGERRR